MRKELVRDIAVGASLAGFTLAFIFGFSPLLAWLGTTFLGY